MKLVKVRETAAEARKQFELAKADRETTAIQLLNVKDELRTILEDRNQSLQRWESTISQTEECQHKLHHYQQVQVF